MTRIEDATDIRPDEAEKLGVRPRRELEGLNREQAYVYGLEDGDAVWRIREAKLNCEHAQEVADAKRSAKSNAQLEEAYLRNNLLVSLLQTALGRRSEDGG